MKSKKGMEFAVAAAAENLHFRNGKRMPNNKHIPARQYSECFYLITMSPIIGVFLPLTFRSNCRHRSPDVTSIFPFISPSLTLHPYALTASVSSYAPKCFPRANRHRSDPCRALFHFDIRIFPFLLYHATTTKLLFILHLFWFHIVGWSACNVYSNHRHDPPSISRIFVWLSSAQHFVFLLLPFAGISS